MNPVRHHRLRSMLEAYADDELDPRDAALVRTHLRMCWWCSGEVQTHRLVRAALRRRREPCPSLPVTRLRRLADTLGRG